MGRVLKKKEGEDPFPPLRAGKTPKIPFFASQTPRKRLLRRLTVAWQIVIHVCLRESRAGELRPSRLPGIEVDVSRTFSKR